MEPSDSLNDAEIVDKKIGFASRSRNISQSDPLANLKAEAQKSRVNAVWEKLKTAGSTSTTSKPVVKDTIKANSLSNREINTSSKKAVPSFLVNLGLVKSKKADKVEVRLEENRETEAQIVEETKEEPQSLTDVAGNALAAAKLALSMNTAADAGKIKITETKEFAGQSVEVETVVDPNSKEGMALKRKAEMKASATKGLDSLLSQIQKKAKINILDKSRKDWNQYKEETGVVEELEVFKKSGETFTERVAFLDRAEVREYEKEREERLAAQSRRKLG